MLTRAFKLQSAPLPSRDNDSGIEPTTRSIISGQERRFTEKIRRDERAVDGFFLQNLGLFLRNVAISGRNPKTCHALNFEYVSDSYLLGAFSYFPISCSGAL